MRFASSGARWQINYIGVFMVQAAAIFIVDFLRTYISFMFAVISLDADSIPLLTPAIFYVFHCSHHGISSFLLNLLLFHILS